jgi:competence protein ComFB
MDIHNTDEDIVYNMVQEIFDGIQAEGNQDNFCLCYQCRMDTMCFALNRIEPHYIVSNRGFSRIEQSGLTRQQTEADISSLIYRGMRLVNHNRRPTVDHNETQAIPTKIHNPVYDIPTIAGRLFDGISFAPIIGIDISLYCDGELIPMRNPNWQNPYKMVPSTPGVFSFWPAPVTAHTPDSTEVFKFSIRVNSPDYEPFSHFFKITATSRFHTPHSYTLNRTYKLPDLYIFPPGDAEMNEDF